MSLCQKPLRQVISHPTCSRRCNLSCPQTRTNHYTPTPSSTHTRSSVSHTPSLPRNVSSSSLSSRLPTPSQSSARPATPYTILSRTTSIPTHHGHTLSPIPTRSKPLMLATRSSLSRPVPTNCASGTTNPAATKSRCCLSSPSYSRPHRYNSLSSVQRWALMFP